MFAFVLSDKFGAPWPSYYAGIHTTAGVVSLSALHWIQIPSIFGVIYFAAVSWVVVLLGLLVYAITSFMRGQFPYLWPFRLLRFMGALSAGILFIPLLQLVLGSFQCAASTVPGRVAAAAGASYWRAQYDCNGGVIYTLQAFSALLGAVLVGLSFLFVSIFYESNSLSRGASSAAHGRVDAIMLAIKTVLVVICQTLVGYLSDAIIIAAVCAASLVWVGAFAFFMPYYAHSVNRIFLAGGVGFAWACVCLIINNYYVSAEGGFFLIVGMPLAIVGGLHLADWRAASIMATPPAQLNNVSGKRDRGILLLEGGRGTLTALPTTQRCTRVPAPLFPFFFALNAAHASLPHLALSSRLIQPSTHSSKCLPGCLPACLASSPLTHTHFL